MNRSTLFTISIVAHVAAAVGLGALEVHRRHTTTSIEFEAVKPKAEPPKAAPPPVAAKAPPPPARRAAPVRPLVAPGLEAPKQAAAPSFEGVPDFGLALGGIDGPGGIPIATTHVAAPAAAVATAPRKLTTSASTLGRCQTEPSKPRPLRVPPPGYPSGADRSVSGRVRLLLQIDESGNVVNVKLLQSLGQGFDAAAMAAVRSAQFEPARRCGKVTRGTFTVALRFSAT